MVKVFKSCCMTFVGKKKTFGKTSFINPFFFVNLTLFNKFNLRRKMNFYALVLLITMNFVSNLKLNLVIDNI